MNLFNLAGKVALVTGGNGGIGLGMARGLVAHGATVVIWGNKAEKNNAALAELEAIGGQVRVAQVDVGNEAAVRQGIDAIVSEFGRIDQAIANAGVSIPRKDMFNTSLEDFAAVERVNVHGVFITLREAARHMMAQRPGEERSAGGSLVAVSSTSAIHGAARNAHYGASKGAVASLARAMAVELAPHGIRVNSILPGWVRSDLTQQLQEWEKFNSNVIGRVPAGRWGEGTDFGAIAVYLASDASAFHLGDSIVVDGGYTIY